VEADPLAIEQGPAREDIAMGKLLMKVRGAIMYSATSVTEGREIVSGDREHRWMVSEQLEDIL